MMRTPPHIHTHTSCLSCRYEEEINKHTTAENEFVVLKKVRGCALPLVTQGVEHRGQGEVTGRMGAGAPCRRAWSQRARRGWRDLLLGTSWDALMFL